MFTLKWFRKSRPRRPSASLKSISWATTTRGPALASPTSMDCTRTMSTLVVPVAPRISARGANHVEIPRRQSARGLITVVSAPVSSMSVTGPPPLTLALTRMGFPGWKGVFVTPGAGVGAAGPAAVDLGVDQDGFPGLEGDLRDAGRRPVLAPLGSRGRGRERHRPGGRAEALGNAVEPFAEVDPALVIH